jgi:hypothetical protein
MEMHLYKGVLDAVAIDPGCVIGGYLEGVAGVDDVLGDGAVFQLKVIDHHLSGRTQVERRPLRTDFTTLELCGELPQCSGPSSPECA